MDAKDKMKRINFKIVFLVFYKMYFQDYFANRSTKFQSYRQANYNIRVRVAFTTRPLML